MRDHSLIESTAALASKIGVHLWNRRPLEAGHLSAFTLVCIVFAPLIGMFLTSLRLQRSYFQDLILFLDPNLFSRLQGSAKIGSDLKIRSDLKNKIAGASGLSDF